MGAFKMLSRFSPRPNRSYKRLFQLVFACSLFILSSPGIADSHNTTASEMKLLPRYCPDTMAYGQVNSPRYHQWVSVMGESFKHMHHYCWAQLSVMRAMKSSSSGQARRGLLENARSDCEYVVGNSAPNFILLPEIYTRLGDIELMLKNPNGANSAFARARQLRPDYWPAYSHWVEFLIRAGKRDEARQLLKTGLEYSPSAKVLLEQYRQVGGKASEIVPRASNPEPEGTPSESANKVADEKAPAEDAARAEPGAKAEK